MARLFWAVLTAVVCVGVVGAGQEPAGQGAPAETAGQGPPAATFRVEVDYVEVDAVVTDAQGNIVTDLTADDFEVFEDGRRQTISAFSFVNLPIARAERPLFTETPIEADVQTNDQVEGRIYLIVLDDQHTDATRAPRVKAAARRFVEQNFGVNDLAAVVYTSGRARDGQEFTNNRQLLMAAIDKFMGRKLPSATLEQLSLANVGPNGLQAGPDAYADERPFRARAVMSTIRQLAEFMGGVRGRRKAMILVGEGVDYDIYEATGVAGAAASSVILDTHDAIAAATRGNVAIYAIDPRGLATGTEELIASASTMPDGSVGVSSIMSEQRRSQDSLRVLADATGGFAAVNRNDLATAFDRIVAENSSYYLLGYYPENDRRSGRFRRLQVRVTRPGLQVRARSGYFEPRGRRRTEERETGAMSPAVAEALGSPIPIAGVPLRVFAAAYKGTQPNAAVALTVEVAAAGLEFEEKDGVFHERLEVAYSAVDLNGDVTPGDRHEVNLALRPETHARVQRRGFRMLGKLELKPGRYQIRVAAGTRTGRTGSVLYDLEVPDFWDAPLALSGVALTSAGAAEGPTVRPHDPLAGLLPGPAAALREFEAGDELAIFAELYERARTAPPHALDLIVQLREEGGQVVREVTEVRQSTELEQGAGGYGFNPRLSLDGVSPGLYVLHVEGRSRREGAAPVSRDIQIRVR